MARPKRSLVVTAPLVAVEQEAVVAPVVAEAPLADATPVAAPVVVEPLRNGKRWRVTRGVWLNQWGTQQWLALGTVIDESVVGAAHIEVLRKHRIPLEEV